jgi:chloramphenicol 3-O-phosphotransferase
MSNLLIIRGSGGSGKSTVGKILRNKLRGKTALLCPDTFYWDICGKENNSELVYEALNRLIDLYLGQGYNVILEGILSKKDENGNLMIKKFIDIGGKFKANVRLFFLKVSLETAQKRDNKRGDLLGKENTKKYHEKSINSKHENEIEIDVENQEPSEITELILSHLYPKPLSLK